jgi:hypothetical protein
MADDGSRLHPNAGSVQSSFVLFRTFSASGEGAFLPGVLGLPPIDRYRNHG